MRKSAAEKLNAAFSLRILNPHDIPLESRLFTTAKLILETLHNDPQASIQRVKNTLQDHAGSLLDPVIVETILQSNDALENIIKELS